jgi:hypothetical protein
MFMLEELAIKIIEGTKDHIITATVGLFKSVDIAELISGLIK